MKVGILTIGWWSRDNYGALLQGFALQRTIQKLNCSVERIRYRQGYDGFRLKFKRFIKRVLWGTPLFLKNRKFSDFQKKFMAFSTKEYKQNDKIPNIYDAIICGSDQVWSSTIRMKGEFAKNWMLDFADDSCKKISYAASFGQSSCSEEAINFIRQPLSKFHRISVRENSGKEICERAGRSDAKVLCDPTLLLVKEDYLSLLPVENKTSQSEPFAICYLVGWKANIPFNDINVLSKKCKIHYVHSHYVGCYYKGLNDKSMSIYEWLSAYSKAEFILSNSFHGTVFAIIMHRPFVCFPLTGESAAMNDRVKTLLSECGLEKRLYNEHVSLEEQLNSSIDWADVDARLSKMRQTSIEFLKEAIFG